MAVAEWVGGPLRARASGGGTASSPPPGVRGWNVSLQEEHARGLKSQFIDSDYDTHSRFILYSGAVRLCSARAFMAVLMLVVVVVVLLVVLVMVPVLSLSLPVRCWCCLWLCCWWWFCGGVVDVDGGAAAAVVVGVAAAATAADDDDIVVGGAGDRNRSRPRRARALFIVGAQLSKTHDVYALDFLGQGKSWPTRAPSRDDGLCYSVDTWTEQVNNCSQGYTVGYPGTYPVYLPEYEGVHVDKNPTHPFFLLRPRQRGILKPSKTILRKKNFFRDFRSETPPHWFVFYFDLFRIVVPFFLFSRRSPLWHERRNNVRYPPTSE